MNLKKTAKWTLTGIAVFILAVAGLAWITTYHPSVLQSEEVTCGDKVSILKPGQKIKVLSWNVQYMAGKNHVFFYDLIDNSGPDERPSAADITVTFNEVARIIRDENPDMILLQELDQGAKRTDYEDQLERLLTLIPGEYRCYSSSWYWKAAYVPHPRIRGAVGMKVAILSKYRIKKALRHQLELIPGDPVTMLFNFRRAVLEVRLPVENSRDFALLTTHLDAFAQGTDTMEKQAGQVKAILDRLSARGISWVIGGDFNLLPPGNAYINLPKEQKAYFNEKTEIEPLFRSYRSVPSYGEANGQVAPRWFTHFPNDPGVKKPDRIIDYLFLSGNVRLGNHYIRQKDTMKISDHFPVVAEILIPK